MNFMKSRCQLQRINEAKMQNINEQHFFQLKNEGKIEIATGIFYIAIIIFLFYTLYQIKVYHVVSAYMEDALATSNLASALIDIEEYGTTGEIVINSPEEAFSIYKQALKINLQLDDNWGSKNTALISGPVEIAEYIVYNVKKEGVDIYCFSQDGKMQEINVSDASGLKTPDGMEIESTTVYSRIKFLVNGILGIQVNAEKEKSVDIID